MAASLALVVSVIRDARVTALDSVLFLDALAREDAVPPALLCVAYILD